MRKVQIAILLGSFVALAASCGDNNHLDCKPGTFQSGDDCVAGDPNDKTAPVTSASPQGGRARTGPAEVTLSSDEPGITIHYTTDGSEPSPTSKGEPSPVVIPAPASGTTIKFFGVDASGNVEATHSETYVIDNQGPAPVTGFTVTPSGQTAMLGWTNPTDSDYKGTLVARIDDVADAGPTPGTLYTAPTALSSFVNVVSAAAVTSASDPGRPTGPARYIAWAYDDLGNYSPGVIAQGNIGTHGLNATLTFDTGTNTVTVTSPATSFDLTGTTGEFSVATATIHLSVKNTTGTYFQDPKIEIVSATNGLFTGSAGTADTYPFKYLGTGFLAPGETRMLDIAFTAAATTTVTVNLALAQHPFLVGAARHTSCCSGHPYRVLDLGSNVGRQTMILSSGGARGSDRDGGMMTGATIVGPHYLDIATNHGTIERWDLVTETLAGSVPLTNNGSPDIVMSVIDVDGYEYAVTRDGRRRYPGALGELIRLDEGLRIVDRLDLSTSGKHGQGWTFPKVSPDHKLLAIPAADKIVLVDLATMSIHDANPSTPEVDYVATGWGTNDRVRTVEWFQGSNGFVAIARTNKVGVVKLGANGYTIASTDYGQKIGDVERTPDGRIWIGGAMGLLVYTPSTDAITTTSDTNAIQALFITGGTLWSLRTDKTTVEQLDANASVTATLSMPAATAGHGGIISMP